LTAHHAQLILRDASIENKIVYFEQGYVGTASTITVQISDMVQVMPGNQNASRLYACSTAQHDMSQHSTAQHSQHSTAQRSAAQYSTSGSNLCSYAGPGHTSTCAVQDPNLRHTLQFGIGMHHAGLTDGDRTTCERLFVAGKIQILVATSTLAWGVNTPAHLVVIKGTEYFDAPSRYPLLLAVPSCLLPDAILQMLNVHNCCM